MKKLPIDKLLELRRRTPERVRGVLSSEKVSTAILSIADKHDLRVDQSGEFANSVNMVLLGALHPSKLVEDIEKDTRVPRDVAVSLAQDANELVLKPIREEILRLHKTGGAEKREDPPQTSEANGRDKTEESEIAPNNTSRQPATEPQTAIVEEKLRKPIVVPREEKTVVDTASKRRSVDPYREPIE